MIAFLASYRYRKKQQDYIVEISEFITLFLIFQKNIIAQLNQQELKTQSHIQISSNFS
ncbi:hypothetical protein D3C84_1138460 [compost metagenome]